MPNIYAPIEYVVPKMPSLLDWLKPEEPDRIYIGPNINWAKIPQNIATLLELLDPSGMMSGPGGFVFMKSAMPASWRTSILSGESKADRIIRDAQKVEDFFKRMALSTKYTPVTVYSGGQLPGGGIGEYIGSGRVNPFGKIRMVESSDLATLLHEGIHRARDADKQFRWFSNYLAEQVPAEIKYKLAEFLTEQGVRPSYPMLIEELPAYLFESQFISPWRQHPIFSEKDLQSVKGILQLLNESLR